MKDIKAVRGSDLVRAMVAEGNTSTRTSNSRSPTPARYARSISAFANNGGGRLLIGVRTTA